MTPLLRPDDDDTQPRHFSQNVEHSYARRALLFAEPVPLPTRFRPFGLGGNDTISGKPLVDDFAPSRDHAGFTHQVRRSTAR